MVFRHEMLCNVCRNGWYYGMIWCAGNLPASVECGVHGLSTVVMTEASFTALAAMAPESGFIPLGLLMFYLLEAAERGRDR